MASVDLEIMGRLIDLTNRHFIRLTVVKRVENNKWGSACWLCECDCGNYKIVRGADLRSGVTRSCGCLYGEQQQTHGMRKTPEYQIWSYIKQRCYNFNNSTYEYYGGRGIKVCDKWLNSFLAFFNDMGKRPGPKYTIERLNNDGNYEPGNCKWATRKEQANNRGSNKAFKVILSIPE
jgi:hypothetical protein